MIRIAGLRKAYGSQEVLHGLDLEVRPGEIFGYVGPNGAGKTTTMKILATVEPGFTGTVEIAGNDVARDPYAVRRLIGFMPEMFGMYEDLWVWEYLDFFARVYDLPVDRRDQLIEDVLVLTDLTGKKDAGIGTLSRGVRQRLYLAKTILHDPQVLLLDEPASGLDPRARLELLEILRELRSRGKTIFISSHILSELSDLCDRVGIIESGRIVASGRVSEIADGMGQQLELVIRTLTGTEALRAALAGAAGVRELEIGEGRAVCRFERPREEVPGFLRSLIEKGIEVFSFEVRERSLERVFMDLTKGEVT